jgi:protein ImuB
VQAISVVPDGPPLPFWWRAVEHVVSRFWGPERLETGWWRDELAARDYYRVETSTGLHAWLFRNRTGDGWYLQGWFE